jgi:hypothetical protein
MNLELKIKNYKILFFYFFVFLFLFCGVNAVMASACTGVNGWCETLTSCDNIDYSATGCETGKYCCLPSAISQATTQTNTSGGLVPAPTGGGGEGDYTLNDFVTVFINIATWILGITGSLALLFFIYGGVMFLISGGSSERVQQAKQIIIGSIIGVVIVLTSFMIINTILISLGYKSPCGNDWYKLITNCP